MPTTVRLFCAYAPSLHGNRHTVSGFSDKTRAATDGLHTSQTTNRPVTGCPFFANVSDTSSSHSTPNPCCFSASCSRSRVSSMDNDVVTLTAKRSMICTPLSLQRVSINRFLTCAFHLMKQKIEGGAARRPDPPAHVGRLCNGRPFNLF